MKVKHILKKAGFTKVLETGKKVSGKTFSLYFTKDKDLEGISVGLIVSRRLSGTAVIRNYLRRKTYAYFQESRQRLDCGIMVIIQLVRDISEYGKRALAKEIKEQMDELSIKAGIKKWKRF